MADFAAAIMPVFGPNGAPTTGGRRIGTLQVAHWLMSGQPRGASNLKALSYRLPAGPAVLGLGVAACLLPGERHR